MRKKKIKKKIKLFKSAVSYIIRDEKKLASSCTHMLIVDPFADQSTQRHGSWITGQGTTHPQRFPGLANDRSHVVGLYCRSDIRRIARNEFMRTEWSSWGLEVGQRRMGRHFQWC